MRAKNGLKICCKTYKDSLSDFIHQVISAL